MDLGLSGKTALITGGARGIGLGAARELAREGANLVLIARHDHTLEAARSALGAEFDVHIETLALDIASPGAAERVARQFPETDILVNNAGANPIGDILSVSEADWRAGWDIKIFGAINFTREFYRLMKERGTGVIVNVVGISSERFDDTYVAGCMGNAAIGALTRILGGRSTRDGIRVVGVSPGTTETDRATGWYRDLAEKNLGDPERWSEFATALPLERPAEPAEIGRAVAFMASDAASYISGEILSVDAGFRHAAGL